MAFKQSDLSVLAYANNFTKWNYQTEDSVIDLLADGYFNDTCGMYTFIGDKLICNTANGGIDLEVVGNKVGKVIVAVWGQKAKAAILRAKARETKQAL